MSECAGCGAEIPDDAGSCPRCGSPASEDLKRATAAPARKPVLAIAAGGVLVLLLLVGVGVFLLWGREGRGSVVSMTTDRPIAGASIHWEAGIAKTDESGRFVLQQLRLGTQAVTVTVPGFAPFKASVRVPVVGNAESEIRLPDASVTVHLEETALQPKDIASPNVRIGGATASRTASGTYEVKGLRPGPATISFTAPSHESTQTTVTLEPGGNDVRVSVSLTPAETYSRYFQAYKSGQWSVAYSYLHPDVAKRESLAVYTKDMKAWGTPLSITIDKTRMLAAWTSPTTKIEYKNVAEIARTLTAEMKGGRYTSALPQHWTRVDGLWLRVDI